MLITVFVAVSVARAEMPAAQSATSPAQAAMHDLLSGSFEEREAAQRRLELLLAQDYRALAAREEILARLRAAPQDAAGMPPLDTAAVDRLVDARVSFSRFVAAVMALPAERQEPLFQWAATDQGAALVARAFSLHPAQALAAAKDLVKDNSPAARWVLLQMINGDDREIELNAMDALWDCKPWPELVDAIWNRATYTQGLMNGRMRGQSQKVLTIRGRQVTVYEQDFNARYRQQDADIAADMLATMKDPSIGKRLEDYVHEIAPQMAEGAEYRIQQLLLGNDNSTAAMGRLIAAYKPREAAPLLMRMVVSPTMRDWSQMGYDNKSYRYSSRITAGAIVLQIAGVDPKTFKLADPTKDGRWAVEGNEAEEGQFIDAMKKWWEARGKDFTTPAK